MLTLFSRTYGALGVIFMGVIAIVLCRFFPDAYWAFLRYVSRQDGWNAGWEKILSELHIELEAY